MALLRGKNNPFPISYKNKLVILVLLLLLIPVLTISMIFYAKASNVISEQLSASFITRLRFSVQNIDSMLKSIEELSYPTIIDKTLEEKLALSRDSAEFNQLGTYNYINNIFNSFLFANNNIDSVYLYSVPGNWLVGAHLGRTIVGEDLRQSDWLKKLASTQRIGRWIQVAGIPQSNGEVKQLIASYKYIYNSTNVPLGALSINISRKLINNILENMMMNDQTAVIVFDADNRIVSALNASMLGNRLNRLGINRRRLGREGYFIAKLNAQRELIAYCVSPYTNWRYAMITPMEKVTEKVRDILQLTIVILVFMVFLGIGIALTLPTNMSRPVDLLVKAMKTVKTGRFDYRITAVRTDEFGDLYLGFNEMMGNLERVIDELYQQKLVQKDLQLKMMQSQINAHFLYNTLDVIHWIARINKVEDICSLTFALSKYFRLNVSEGRDVIPLRDVVELIVNYIAICKIKSEQQIRLEIRVPEELLELQVLKYIFQPLIENAIQHGIEKTRRDGVIGFSCQRQENNLLFTITDNGLGIKPEVLQSIRADLNDFTMLKKGNFALKNIHHQIKVFYGEVYGLSITSEYEAGTIINVLIPIREDETHNVQAVDCG